MQIFLHMYTQIYTVGVISPTAHTILEYISQNLGLITFPLHATEKQPLRYITSFKLVKYSIEYILYLDTSTPRQN